MTDHMTPDQTGQTPKKGGRKPVLKAILALSLALNLAVVGAFAGMALRADGGRPHESPTVRDFSFGPFSAALSREQRRSLRQLMSAEGPAPRELHKQMAEDMMQVLTSLKAQPFDPIALQSAMRAQGERVVRQSEAVRLALVDVILEMSEAERALFAQKLEQNLERRPTSSSARPQTPARP